MKFELQHSDLPSFAKTWPEEIERIITSRLGTELVSDDVRTIVLSIARGRQRVGVWVNLEWENYPYAEDDSTAAGFLSLSPWLDGVDAIARGEQTLPAPEGWSPRLPMSFDDGVKTASFRAWWLELHRGLTASAMDVATKRLAKHFTQPVGVFVSMTGSEARLVAFCHAEGAPLWPIRESRREHGYGGAYTHGTLRDDAMTMFYPQGEGADEGGAPTIRRRPVATIESASFDDDSLELTFAGEPFPIKFTNGHTNEEMGGPANSDVAVALRAFATKAGKLSTTESPVVLPAAADFQAAFDAQGEAWYGWLERLIKSSGARAVSERVLSLGFGAKRMQDLHRGTASLACDVQAWDVVLAHFAPLTGKLRTDWQWLETRALVALGRWAEVLAPRGAEAVEAGAKKSPERGLAFFALGDLTAARAEVEGSTDGDGLAVLAMIEAGTSESKAIDAMTRALSDGIRDHLEVHLRAHPLLGRLMQEREAFRAALAASRAAVVALTPSTIDQSHQVTLRRPPAEALFAAPFVEDGEGKFRRAVRRSGGWVVNEDDERVVEWVEGKPPVTLWEGDVDELAVVPEGLIAASRERLVLLDPRGQELAALTNSMRFTDKLATRGSLIACGFAETVRLARVEGTGLRWCGALKANESTYLDSFGFVGADRLLLASSEGLVLVDCSNEAKPEPIARVDGEYKIIDSWDGFALLSADEHVMLLDVGALRSVWTVKCGNNPAVAHTADGRRAVASRGEVLLIDPKSLATERLLGIGPEGYALDDTLALTIEDNRIVAILKQFGMSVLERVPFDAGAIRQVVETELPRVRAWVHERFEQWVSEGVSAAGEDGEEAEAPALPFEPFGGVTGLWLEHAVRLYPQGPRTVVNARQQGCAELEFERPEAPRKKGKDERSEGERKRADALTAMARELATQVRTVALEKVLREAAASFAPRTRVKDLFVGIEVEHLRVIDVLRGGGAQPPFREAVKPTASRSLLELMSARNWYASVDAWALRAKREPEFRAEVLALLATGKVRAADRVAQQLATADVDLEGCAKAWFSAAEVDRSLALEGLLLLGEKGHVEARARLVPLCDEADPEFSLPARRVLGRLDEDATLALVRTCLSSLEEYEEDDVPVRTLAALSEGRIAQLKDALLAAKAVLARPGPLLVPLLRAGWTLDEKSLAQGNKSRMEDDDFMGELFGTDDEPDATATAVRLFLAKQISENLRSSGRLWPTSPLEKSRLGWQRFFTVAWPEWERSGVLDTLLEALPARAANSTPDEPGDGKLGADASFALQVLHQSLLRGDARATKYAAALEKTSLPEKAREPVIRLARTSRLMFGWSLLKQERFAEARKVATAALHDSPDDGQVLFFEARLCWLEQKDARAALPRIEAGLLVAADSVGRARLLNLQGAVWDELGDYEKSLQWFHKALALSDATGLDHDTGQKSGDPSMTHAILSNIAEAHWKRGERVEARDFADQAARRGSKTEIVKSILAETTEPLSG